MTDEKRPATEAGDLLRKYAAEVDSALFWFEPVEDGSGIKDAQQAAAESIDVYRMVNATGKMATAVFSDIKSRCRRVLDDISEETLQMDWKSEYGSSTVRAPHTRVSYNAKALDALCESSPELAKILKPHRKETHVAGGRTIR